jgi:hypothetical protein
MSEHEPGDFCRDIGCPVQKCIDDGMVTRDRCRESCIKTAREFHEWLKKNGYKIIGDAVVDRLERASLTLDKNFPGSIS